MTAALENIRVADFSHVFAGPYCTLALADMGAEVIKIEPPQGDASRGYPPLDPSGESASFLCMNRNKKGVVLDLSDARGQQLAREIVARADVVVENFATGVMQRFGLDYETLSKDNPRLIYCSISAYGRSGPYADRAGYDPVIQAESGMMSLNGDPDGVPYRSGVAFVDLGAGMFAAQAILAALYARSIGGLGQFIDVPLYDSAISLTGYHMMTYLASGSHPGRQGNSSPIVGPMGLFDANDGKFFLTVAGDSVWRKLVRELGDPPELAGPEYATNRKRVQESKALASRLQVKFRDHSRAHWIDRLRLAGVPAGPVNSIAEAVEAPETTGRGIIGTAPHTRSKAVPNVRLPHAMHGTPLIAPLGAPLLGEHTHEVLTNVLGYTVDQIAALQADGVLGQISNDKGVLAA